MYVSDVVRANLAAAATNHMGEAFNVGSGSSTTIRELAEHVLEITGSGSDIVNTEERPGDIQHSCADLTRAHTELNYEPTVSLLSGLSALFDYVRTDQ